MNLFKDILGLSDSNQKSSSNCKFDRHIPYPGFLGFTSETTIFRADLHPSSSEPLFELGRILKEGYKLKMRKGIKRITVFRFLTAKLLYEEEGLHLDEYIVLFELYYSLYTSEDPGFVRKYRKWFERTQPFFDDLTKAKSFPVRLEKSSHTEQAYQEFLSPVIPTKRSYFGLRGQKNLRQSYSLKLNSALPVQKIPPKSYIGVGYRDKGSRKDVARDGSPAWQEVASHFTELERRLEEEQVSDHDQKSGFPLRE